ATLLGLWKGLMEMEPELRKGADARLLLELTLLQNLGQAASAGAPVVAGSAKRPPVAAVAGTAAPTAARGGGEGAPSSPGSPGLPPCPGSPDCPESPESPGSPGSHTPPGPPAA